MIVDLLIHGPFVDFSELVLKDAICALRRYGINKCVVSTYPDDAVKANSVISQFGDVSGKFVVVAVSDVDNPGFANINRQINLVRAGLSAVTDGAVVIKLRADQRISFKRLFSLIEVFGEGISSGKLMTTNCYTRVDRSYHPSDMFLVGLKNTLLDYYPSTFFKESELETKLAIRADSIGMPSLFHVQQWPESRLFRNLLKMRGWSFQENVDDSRLAIATHCIVLNARDIKLRWDKFYAGKLSLVPYKFHMAPFENIILEEALCYGIHELHGYGKVSDGVTRLLTRLLWNDFYLAGRHYGSFAVGIRRVLKGKYKVKK
jgi:hypothetical protein